MTTTTPVTTTAPARRHRISWRDVQQVPAATDSAPIPIPENLRTAVRRLDGAIGVVDAHGHRRVPSAGSCYPYELTIHPAERPDIVAEVDLVRRRVVLDPATARYWEAERYGFALVGRPWLSLRKYGKRGYLYHLLDIGHAAANLELALGRSDHNGPKDPHRASVSPDRAVVFGLVTAGSPALLGSTDWLFSGAPASTPSQDNAFEAHADAVLPAAAPALEVTGSVEESLAALRVAIPARRSSPGFTDSVDVGPSLRAIELFTAVVDRWTNRPAHRVPGHHIVRRRPAIADDLRNALRGQAELADAHAFVVLHVPIPEPTTPLTADVQEQITLCGFLGQIAYLCATACGAAVTAVGGIDPPAWARLCGTGDEVVYVVAIGHGADGVKADRLAPSGAHRR